METGEVKERNLTGTPFAMEFPMINPNFNGVKNKFGYTQTVHDSASASSGGREEDDGWIITFVHDEDTNTSKVYIIDTKNFTSEPVAKITLPCRVPYGFHGAFMPTPLHN
uniref:Uncharacterized protein n=1 Tax=Salix viminalis TaxID=40686 RepID=A0A6N2NHI3_SALVM